MASRPARPPWRVRSASCARRPAWSPAPGCELARVDLSNSISDERAVLFLATGLTHGEAEPDPTEALEIRWVPFDEALAMTLDGRITDVMSVAAIQRVALARLAAAASRIAEEHAR